MTTPIFRELLTKFNAQVLNGKVSINRAKEWFRKQAEKIATISGNTILGADTKRLRGSPIKDSTLRPTSRLNIKHTGRMIMFFYDPLAESKKKMFAYDTFPLVMPIKFYGNGFLGLNLHYLPIALRARLLDALYTLYKDQHLNEKKQLQVSYDILNSSAKYRWFKPCVHRYLYINVKSRFLVVDPNEWDMMLTLPTERFVPGGGTKQNITRDHVWNKSREAIGYKSVKIKKKKVKK